MNMTNHFKDLIEWGEYRTPDGKYDMCTTNDDNYEPILAVEDWLAFAQTYREWREHLSYDYKKRDTMAFAMPTPYWERIVGPNAGDWDRAYLSWRAIRLPGELVSPSQKFRKIVLPPSRSPH